MALVDILQHMKADTERFLHRLNNGESRLYEISSGGAIVERTHEFREHHEGLLQRLQRAIDTARTRAPNADA